MYALVNTAKLSTLLLLIFTHLSCAQPPSAGGSQDLGSTKSATNTATTKTDAAAEFVAKTGIPIPHSATVMFSEAGGGIDPVYKLILAVNQSDYAAWKQQLQITEFLFDESKRYLLGTDSGEWTPNKETTLPTTSINYDNGMVMILGTAPLATGTIKVYLVYFGT